ncbi:MAG: SDR family oxidoreductase [Rikenellaceae bacterium]
MNFKNKVVLITGTSSGIGYAMAEKFGELGAKIVMGARSEKGLAELSAKLTAKGVENVYTVCDVTKESDCAALVQKGVDAFGGVDVCICNAGISMRALFDDVKVDVLKELMDVNFWGAVHTIKYALPYIQKAKGSIVGISSVAGLHGLPARTGYSASKYAMQGFLDTIRIENLKKDVHVMVAAPGFTASNVRFTARTADGSVQGESPREETKMATAEEVATMVAKGVYKRKRELIMDFQGKATKLIKKFFPTLLDKLFYNHMAKEPNSPLK